MELYKLGITDKNKIWRKYIIFSENFVQEENEVHFTSLFCNNPEKECKIQALVKGKGVVAQNQSSFDKVMMPEFSEIRNLFFIKEDIFNYEDFSVLNGIFFKSIKVYGDFIPEYKLLLFDKIIDCIDEEKSIRKSFEYLSTLVLDGSKIPQNIDGFFLKNWNKYGKYHNIVNERLKEQLLTIPKAKEFLIFDKLQISGI